MKNKSFYLIIVLVVLLGTLTGCTSHPSKMIAMNDHNMKKDSTVISSDESRKAFTEEINGFIIIEEDLKKNDFKDASKVADGLHKTFHSSILPALKDKKGETYAEDIHGKYDELQDAIKAKDIKKIDDLIKLNRDNLIKVADILGTSINK